MKNVSQLALPFGSENRVKIHTVTASTASPLKSLVNANELKILSISNKDDVLLNVIIELGARYLNESSSNRTELTNPMSVHDFSKDHLRHMQNVGFLLILVDTKHQVTHVCCFESVPSLSTILRRTVARTAAAFFVARKATGQPDLTEPDRNFLKKLEDGGDTIGIDLLDYLVCNESQYVSAREQGLL